MAFEFRAMIQPYFKTHPPCPSGPLWLEHVVEDLLRSRSADLAKVNEVLQLAPVPPRELDRTFGPQLVIHEPRFHRDSP